MIIDQVINLLNMTKYGRHFKVNSWSNSSEKTF